MGKDKKETSPLAFGHSGDMGDIIYSLPAIRAAGGGTLYVFPDHAVREAMTPVKAASLHSLLIEQPYIHDVVFQQERFDCDLNDFRKFLLHGMNLADAHLRATGFGWTKRIEPWLTVQPKKIEPVVVNRTARYHGNHFSWEQIVDCYRDNIVFTGTPQEHRDFVGQFGEVDYYPTETLLELAQVIAGAQLFIGNQSCPAAIAEGLKQNMILEVCCHYDNCRFNRLDKFHFTGESFLELPNIG